MQLKWIEFNCGKYFETNVFGNNYSVVEQNTFVWNDACGAGFHFFKTAIEAWNYKFN